VTAYEALLAMDCLGWEAQQTWLSAHYSLAEAYREGGQLARAREVADRLLTLWKDADPDLPLLRRTRELRQQLDPSRTDPSQGRNRAPPRSPPGLVSGLGREGARMIFARFA
jgi:hypothetical protein